ncbi:MAG TPA: aminoacetone oxidase family FAD-binding enzyme [Longimicrobiaceae bacterium]
MPSEPPRDPAPAPPAPPPSGRPPIVVVGAGAAGLMAAGFAAGTGAPVLLLERTRDGGRKILISGGGRCNVLPSQLDPARYHTASSPNSLRKMLLSWPLAEQRRFFEERLGLPLALEPETGKLFPVSNRARDVRDGLVDFVRREGGSIRFESRVTALHPPSRERGWRVAIEGGDEIDATAVVLATGGLSVPQTGSDGGGLRIAAALGHEVHPTYPALTPLLADPPVHASLAGISLRVRLTVPLSRGEEVAEGGFLFTHRGYSGPSVLDVSHHAVLSAREEGARQAILARWTERDSAAWDRVLREGAGGTVAPVLRRALPARLADRLLEKASIDPDRPLSQLRRDERLRLVDLLTRYPLPWTGDEGYRKAEVTGGGVSLGDVHPRTLESRVAPGLFLCGEILDAFGPIGGYNFAWAWATGRTAGLGAAASLGAVGGDGA